MFENPYLAYIKGIEVYKKANCPYENKPLKEVFKQGDLSAFNHLQSLNIIEQYYKDCFIAAQQGEEYLSDFLSTMPPDIGLYESWKRLQRNNDFLLEKDFFTENENVTLCPHYRYDVPYLHAHEFYEFTYVLAGSCCINNNDEIYCLRAGEMSVTPPNQNHMVCVFDSNTIVINILARSSTFAQIFPSVFSRKSFVSIFFTRAQNQENNYTFFRFCLNNDERLKKLFILFLYEHYNKTTRPVILKEYLMQAFLGYLIYMDNSQFILSKQYSIQEANPIVPILRFIADNFRTVSLKSTAEAFNYSPQHLSRLIKKETNSTFTDVVQKHKLATACNLLSNTNIMVTDIADICGFQNREHFTRTFCRKYHMSPSTYRKKYAGKQLSGM